MTESELGKQRPEDQIDPRDQAFLGVLLSRLVGICWVTRDLGFQGEKRGDPKALCATATVIEVNGRWYLMTAGHVVKIIAEIVGDPAKRITMATLFNGWATAQQAIQFPLPIDLYQAKWYLKYNRGEGIDFGLILLEDEQARILKERGSIPFRERDIGVPSSLSIEQFWLLGLPEELQEHISPEPGTGGECELNIEPNLFRVFSCAQTRSPF